MKRTWFPSLVILLTFISLQSLWSCKIRLIEYWIFPLENEHLEAGNKHIDPVLLLILTSHKIRSCHNSTALKEGFASHECKLLFSFGCYENMQQTAIRVPANSEMHNHSTVGGNQNAICPRHVFP